MRYIFLAAITIIVSGFFFASIFLGSDERGEVVFEYDVNKKYALSKDIDYSCPGCNILMIAMTNVRRDAVGVFNQDRLAVTPNINKLAKQSIIFDRMHSVASWTLPVSVSIFTSLYPLDHLVVKRDRGLVRGKRYDSLDEGIVNIIDLIKEQGIYTAGFTGNFDYRTKFGATSAFDHFYLPDELNPELYSDREVQEAASDWYGSIGDSADEFIQWLGGSNEEQWFAYIQGFDAHCEFEWPESNRKFVTTPASDHLDFKKNCYWNFVPTEPIVGENGEVYHEVFASLGRKQAVLTEDDVQHMRELYWGEVNLVDQHIGRVIDELESRGELENTIVMIYAEHGDLFGEHGRFMRGGPLRGTFYDEVLHVPFVLYHPKISDEYGGVRIPELSSMLDLAPTIADILDIEQPDQFEGSSLFDIASGAIVRPAVMAASVFIPQSFNFYFSEASMAFAYYTDRFNSYGEMRIPVDEEDYTLLGHSEDGVSQVQYNKKVSFEQFANGIENFSVEFNDPKDSLSESAVREHVFDHIKSFKFFNSQ